MSMRLQLFLLLALLLLLPQLAFAADTLTSTLNKIVEWLTGPGGKAIVIIAVGAALIGAIYTRHVNWQQFIIVLVAGGLLIGAGEVYKFIAG